MLPETFRTARLFLRPIAMADAGPIFAAYARNPEVTRFLIWRPNRTRRDFEAYIRGCLDTPPHRARTYVMQGRKDSVIRGGLDLRQADRHRLEFGYVLAPAWWGQGLMTEALTEIVRWALAQPTIFRIGAVCDVENVGSARVMEKAGLVREGMLRRYLDSPRHGQRAPGLLQLRPRAELRISAGGSLSAHAHLRWRLMRIGRHHRGG